MGLTGATAGESNPQTQVYQFLRQLLGPNQPGQLEIATTVTPKIAGRVFLTCFASSQQGANGFKRRGA